MKSNGLKILAAALVGLCGTSLWAMRWENVPLDKRLADAERVVIGTVVEVSTRSYSFSSHNYGKNNSTLFFDRGVIKVSKSLKGKAEGHVGALFESKDQVMMHGHPPRSHAVGEEGIWLLKRSWLSGEHYLPGPPPNPLPLSSLNDVKGILE